MPETEQYSSQFERELHEQPDSLARLLERGRSHAEALADRIRTFDPRLVLIAARGSSDNAARYANYLFGVRHGLVTVLASPSIVTRYKALLRTEQALVFGVSQSGRSPDIVAMVDHAGRHGALTIALTNDVESPLARVSANCFPLETGVERAVAASKTYSNQLLGFAMLSAAIRHDSRAWTELAMLPDAMRRTVASAATLREGADRFREASNFAVISRGFNVCTAHEIALKIMEVTYIMAQAFALPDFLHGPVAMLDARLPAILVAMHGAITEDVIGFIKVIRERGTPLIGISDRDDVLGLVDVPLRVAAKVPEWLSPIVATVPGQFLALQLAYARRLSPDQPRGLSKVTETE